MSYLRRLFAQSEHMRFMIEAWQKIFELTQAIESRVRINILLNQILSVGLSVVELLSLFSIVPFLGLLANPELFVEKAWMIKLSNFLGNPDITMLTVYLGLFSLSMLILRHALTYLMTIAGSRLVSANACILFDRMIHYYFHKTYEFHLQHHSTILYSNLTDRLNRVVSQLIGSFLTLIQAVIFCVLCISALIYQDPLLAFIGTSSVFIVFIVFVWWTENILRPARHVNFVANNQLQQEIQDSLNATEDILVQNRAEEYASYLSKFYLKTRRQQLHLNQVPMLLSPALEIALYTAVILTIAFYVLQDQALVQITSLALFGLVSYRMLPYIQRLHTSYNAINNGIVAYDFIRDDLLSALQYQPPKRIDQQLVNWQHLECKNIDYHYNQGTTLALKDVNLRIDRGTSVGFCGVSGSGKSTLIRVLLGLLEPEKGKILIDGQPLHSEKLLPLWQNNLAYVSQNIVMFHLSIAQNVAMSLTTEDIDYARVQWALSCAQLDDYLASTPDGLNTRVMERGLNMSIGQRQRLAIARALYHKRTLLIMDEGTSSLDGKTESSLLRSISDVQGDYTVVMIAHRLNTIRNCDTIYVMRDGQIVDSGSYDELYARSLYFRELSGSTN